jgi:hypothetical protein
MAGPRTRAALALAALLGVGAYVYPPQRRGDVEAVLEVDVAERGPGPGLAAADYVVRLSGPADLEVDVPRLEDAAAAWKVDWRASGWRLEDGRAAVAIEIHLAQVKPGPVPLPDVRLRFQEGPGAPWQEVEWLDVLRQTREGPPPGPYTPEPGRQAWLLPAALGVVVLAAVSGWALWRRRPSRPVPLAASVRALKELDRLEQSALPPAADSATFHTRVSDVVRRYLLERFGLPAPERTTSEFLGAAADVPELAACGELLRDFCDRCDLAKFANAALTAEECRTTAGLARSLVERTAPGREVVT